MNELYWVHRLLTWPDGYNEVEVCESFDSTSCHQLGRKYPELGEGKGYDNPKEAAIVAVRVMRQWEKDTGKEITLSINGQFAGEMGVPPSDVTVVELFAWTRRHYLALERCSQCGEIVQGKAYEIYELDEEKFCGEHCAEKAYYDVEIDVCPSCDESIYRKDVDDITTMADHGACWSCQREMVNGERCRICKEMTDNCTCEEVE